MSKKATGGATPATVAMAASGRPFTLHPYTHDDDNHAFGDEAAERLGIDPMRMFKTLVVDVGDERPELAVAVVPVSSQLNMKAFAAEFDTKKVALADPDLAVRSSGYVVGGISPLGQKHPLPTLVDETAELFETIYVSAGKRGLSMELRPDDLVVVTEGRFADIAR